MDLSKKIIFFTVFTTIILAYYVTVRIDAPSYELKLKRHYTIINNTIEYPYKYRVINPYMANIYFSVFKSFVSEKAAFLLAYFIQNILIYGLLVFASLNFLKLWFDDTGAVIGTLMLALLIPISITGYDTLGDTLTAALLAFGFCCINKGKIFMLFPIVFIGAFNELQIVLLIVFYMIGNKNNFKDKKAWINFGGLIATFLIAYAVLYWLRGGEASKDDYVWYFTKDAAFNIARKDWMILWFFMIAPFIYFVFKDLKQKPEFLRRNLLFTLPVFYFGAFFFMARLREIDKALAIFLILIPLALYTLIPSHIKKT